MRGCAYVRMGAWSYLLIGFVISAIITYVFTLPVIRGFIVIVKTAEYHNAKVASKYDIK